MFVPPQPIERANFNLPNFIIKKAIFSQVFRAPVHLKYIQHFDIEVENNVFEDKIDSLSRMRS